MTLMYMSLDQLTNTTTVNDFGTPRPDICIGDIYKLYPTHCQLLTISKGNETIISADTLLKPLKPLKPVVPKETKAKIQHTKVI